MSNTHIPSGGTVPKCSRVTEICQEWMVREDSAMAYQLQNQEIRQHYSGNKQRNAVLREDYPKAKDEQLKEQELAEQAAAVYKKMLEEQEEIDKMLAEKLAQKLEFEEKQRKKTQDREHLHLAKRLQDEAIEKPPVFRQFKPNRNVHSFPDSPNGTAETPPKDYKPLMFEPPVPVPCRIPKEPDEELSSFKSQEEADAELARMLQEQEGDPEVCILERDRLLAIEAQDKELARVLQERERVKAKKAKERAKQRALAKKQQQIQQQQQQIRQDVIMPDDAYSNPADMISPVVASPSNARNQGGSHQGSFEEYEDNYSLPVDGINSYESDDQQHQPVRPSQLNVKPLYKQDEAKSPGKHSNIAMAIDPTYPKQGVSIEQSPSYLSPGRNSSNNSGSISSKSTPSNSPLRNIEEPNNAPPYMPIQGQRRTASLEKRRVRDGCKQQ